MVRLAINLQKAIRFVLTDWPGFPDRYYITDVCFAVLVVSLEASGLLDPLLIERMSNDVLDRNHDGLLHLVAHNPTGLGLDLTRHLYLLFPFGQERKNP